MKHSFRKGNRIYCGNYGLATVVDGRAFWDDSDHSWRITILPDRSASGERQCVPVSYCTKLRPDMEELFTEASRISTYVMQHVLTRTNQGVRASHIRKELASLAKKRS